MSFEAAHEACSHIPLRASAQVHIVRLAADFDSEVKDTRLLVVSERLL
jgi:hypothetical protein